MAPPTVIERKKEIFNGALLSVSASPLKLNSAQDGFLSSPEATAIIEIWPLHYEALPPLAQWEWARKRDTLTAAADRATTGHPDYAAKYTLPDDFVRMIGVLPSSGDPPDFIVENGDLYISDDGDITIRYLSDSEENLRRMDGATRYLLKLSLAIDLATHFMRNEEMARRLSALYTVQLQIALSTVQSFVDLPTINFEAPLLLPQLTPRGVAQ